MSSLASKYAIVLPLSSVYKLAARVFMESFVHYHSDDDIGIIFLNYDLPQEYYDQWDIPHEIVQLDTSKPPAMVCKLEGYRYAGQMDKVTMLADADSFFCANVKHLFDIASLGYIVGSANGQNILFKESYEKGTGIKGITDRFNYRTIAAPLVIDPAKHGHLFVEAVETWESIGQNHSTSIWMLFNAMVLKHNKVDRVISFPAQQMTNLHQKMLKQGTRVRRIDGKLMTEDGLQVLMVHDKWWKPEFLNGLMRMAEKYCNTLKGFNHFAQWKQSRDLIKEEFDKWGNADENTS
jgi:hypothetical protein